MQRTGHNSKTIACVFALVVGTSFGPFANQQYALARPANMLVPVPAALSLVEIATTDTAASEGKVKTARWLAIGLTSALAFSLTAVFLLRSALKRRTQELEKSLLQTQQSKAQEHHAAGVAHDLNNMITGIAGNLALAKVKVTDQDSDAADYLNAAERGLARAAELAKELHSRQTVAENTTNSANDVIELLLELIRPTLDPRIKLVAELDRQLHLALFDPIKLEQVLLNLVMNARDAIQPHQGEIRITTRNVRAAENPSAAPADYVQIAVADSGTGMEPAVMENIFEPFFSTKAPGKGSGLGLASSQSAIQQLGGWIDCQSQPSHGSTFRVFLPSLSAEAASQTIAETSTNADRIPPAVLAQPQQAKRHVLCVDDEEYVRSSAESLLQSMGYLTSSASNGAEALDFLSRVSASGESFPDVVLLDQTMPHLSGAETLREIRERFPDLPVVLCSGFLTDRVAFATQAGSHPEAYLPKPYDGQQLEAVLKSVRRKASATAS